MAVVWIQNASHRLVGLSTLFPDGGTGKYSCGTVRRTEPYRGKRVPGCVGVLRFYSSAPLPVLCQLPVCRCHVTINLLLLPPCLPQHDAMHLLKLNVRTAPVLLPIPSWPELCNSNKKSELHMLIHRADTMELGLWLQRIHLPRRNTCCLNSVPVSTC